MYPSTKPILRALVLSLVILAVPAAVAYSGGSASTASAGVATAKTLTGLNLRPEPNTLKPPLTVIPGGTTIEVFGRNTAATWLSVAYASKQGWVSAPYVVLTSGTVRDLPIVGAATPPPATPPPASVSPVYTAHLSNIGPNVDAIYQRGQQLGNNPRAFTKVGDCEMEFKTFLQEFDAGSYNLADYQYLQGVLTHFAGSFGRLGDVANSGMSSSAIFQSYWSDPAVCYPGETPLACEYRVYKPSIALIMIRTIDHNAVANGQFYSEVTQAVRMSVDQGVIPVLSTIPYWGPINPDVTLMNDIVRRVATENNVPLWDFWLTSEQLPNHGVTQDYHINDPAYTRATYFDAASLQMAVTRRNLEALEVLHAILTEVSQ